MKQYKCNFECVQFWKNENIVCEYIINVEAYNMKQAIDEALKKLTDFLQVKFSRLGFCTVFTSESECKIKMAIKDNAVFIVELDGIKKV